ncbi:transcription factor S-II, central domain-containing protein [Polychytrium aggregatum]|uniref:transcription factor S-II, central domain-containing protein n=1 Tax=Polychytrium aggregatum TaxID=110093 RepID=UPI0022FEDC68|nr:transcription factor S-II, central domain-containing protein [Polychytrium aggregatum]KAI9207723.1 transcription factor S-II, central domain-containing protein [Polychytrium aggregatum]
MSRIEEDVLSLKQAIVKSLPDSKSSAISDALLRLNRISVTKDLLRKTKIGVVVGDLRKNEKLSSEVRQAAKSLVGKWKKEIEEKPSTATGAAESLPSPSAAETKKKLPAINTAVVKESSPAAAASPVSSASSTPTVRTIAGDKLKFSSSGDTLRDKCIGMLYTSLAKDTDTDGKRLLSIAMNIEASVSRELGSQSPKYTSKISSLSFNLKKNADLRWRVITGAVGATDFANMSKEDMMTASRKAEVEEAHKESLHWAVTATDTQAETDMFKCGRCGQRKTKYFQKQTRSADEPMTTFVTCVNCDNRWKFC